MARVMFDPQSYVSIGWCLILIPILSDVVYAGFEVGKMFLVLLGLFYLVRGYRRA